MTLHKKLLEKFLFKKCLYLGKRSYLIRPGGEFLEVGKDFSDRVNLVILARESYFETVRNFPFTNLKDIKAAVEMDRAAYSPLVEGRVFIRKIKTEEGGVTVNLWFVDEQTTAKLERLSPLLVIPESAFPTFTRGTERVFAVREDDEGGFFAFVSRAGGVRSLLAQGLQGDFKHFTRIIGAVVHDCPMIRIRDGKDFFSFFPTTVYDMSIRDLGPFLSTASRSLQPRARSTKIGLLAAVLIFGFYLLISGIYPGLVRNRLRQENQALAGSLTDLLDKRKAIDHYRRDREKLAAPLNQYPYKLPLLNMLNRVLPTATTIVRLTVTGRVVEMQGVTPRASELMDSLAREPGVKNARFTAPLKEDKKTGGEFFRLTFVHDRS